MEVNVLNYGNERVGREVVFTCSTLTSIAKVRFVTVTSCNGRFQVEQTLAISVTERIGARTRNIAESTSYVTIYVTNTRHSRCGCVRDTSSCIAVVKACNIARR